MGAVVLTAPAMAAVTYTETAVLGDSVALGDWVSIPESPIVLTINPEALQGTTTTTDIILTKSPSKEDGWGLRTADGTTIYGEWDGDWSKDAKNVSYSTIAALDTESTITGGGNTNIIVNLGNKTAIFTEDTTLGTIKNSGDAGGSIIVKEGVTLTSDINSGYNIANITVEEGGKIAADVMNIATNRILCTRYYVLFLNRVRLRRKARKPVLTLASERVRYLAASAAELDK